MSEMQLEDVKTMEDLLEVCGMAPGSQNPTPQEALRAAIEVLIARIVPACLHHCAGFWDTEEGLLALETGPSMSELVAHYGDDDAQAAELAALREENALRRSLSMELDANTEQLVKAFPNSPLARGIRSISTEMATLASARPAPAQEQGEDMREAVRWFAGEMERKLRANDHKGGWRGCDRSYLLARLREEYEELIDATAPEDITSEAADVANFAMMIADQARALLARKPAEEAKQ